ncbi:MAG: tRNA epoxyqueuosine(34) reductase QueG [Bacteroidaceae bacterium]|nr:tRNA epoxyqueuosine(34) reductase QueG [Bacteroidaceae bacterium]
MLLTKEIIKARALSLGFVACGTAKAGPVDSWHTDYMERWLQAGCNGIMSYLERNREKRYNPTLLEPGCRTVVSVAFEYGSKADVATTQDSKVARFARFDANTDYHRFIKDKLYTLLEDLNTISDVRIAGRAFVDSAPLMERYWATECGVGYSGKNHLLFVPGIGSYVLLGELLIDTPLPEYDKPLEPHCHNCGICISKCPGMALSEDFPYIDACKCVSYRTIELTGRKRIGTEQYGCDVCQEHCPLNSGK